MNETQKKAVQQIIGNLEDDLYRYRLSEQHQPGQVTGNGEPFTNVIASLEQRIAELKGR